MLISEFIDRTGFRPTEDYYHTVIESDYMKSDLDKDAWCKQWKRNGGIQKAYDAMCKEAANEYANVLKLEADIKTLNEQIDNLKDECNQLYVCKEMATDLEAEKQALIEFIISDNEAYCSPTMRQKVIELMGAKEYISYKIEHEMTLWQSDKDLIIELLNK